MDTKLSVGVVWPSEPTPIELEELDRFVPDGIDMRWVAVNQSPEPAKGITLEHVAGLAGSSIIEQKSLELVPYGVSAIAYACTSASYVRGVGGDKDISTRVTETTNLPATTTSTAAVLALRNRGVRDVAVLSPHIDPINDRLKLFLEGSGFNVVSMKGLNRLRDIDQIPPEINADMVTQEMDRPDANGIFISCTSMQVAAILRSTERRVGKPVVSALQATVWELLRLAGTPCKLSDLIQV